ncbi:S8 family serine peptidase [Dapis sp. BLCC M172]|uniref:S8 family serine peptidase n=1 Tax=Dapis sp. BLCC M172 TaxID=2975281 RepID=UPI003CF0E846
MHWSWKKKANSKQKLKQNAKEKRKKRRSKTFILEEIISPSVAFCPVLPIDDSLVWDSVFGLFTEQELVAAILGNNSAIDINNIDVESLFENYFAKIDEYFAENPTEADAFDVDNFSTWPTLEALINPGQPSVEIPDVGGVVGTLPPPVTIPIDPPRNNYNQDYDFPVENQPLVGVIDTGFSGNNPDIDYTRITLGSDRLDNDNNPLLQSGEGNEHGTHVLGIIGATRDNGIGIDGINDKAPLWLGRAIGSGEWAESLVEFVDDFRESSQPNALANLSLDLTQTDAEGNVTTRYEFTPEERAALEYARKNGVLIVAAAGNDGGVMSVLGQASQEFDNIVTVGAADGENRAAYSSYGNGLDILAPGGTESYPLFSTIGDGLGTMAGTSVATAQMSGAASLVWAANPDLNYRQVIEILKSTAKDVQAPGWDEETGAGLLNINMAMELAKVTTPQEYEVPSILIPETWSGAGQVIPGERAVQIHTTGNFSGTVTATIGANLRSGPGTNYNRVGSANYQQQLQYDAWQKGEYISYPGLGSDDRWYRIAGTDQWISAAITTGEPPAVQIQPPPTQPSPPDPIPDVPINSNSPNYRSGPVNPFAYHWIGQCTWYTYGRMLETGLLPAAIKNNALFRGNAWEWKGDAQKVGLPITSTPTPGARGIVVWPPNVKGAGSVGHVAFLEEVYPDGRVRITEANWPTGSWIKERILTPAQYAGLSFVRLENAQTNNYSAPPATPGQNRQYIVRPNDNLWNIAQRELGDGNRWREIMKTPNGSTFTEAEALNLQVGQSVYLPVSYQTGTGQPITPPPSSNPQPSSRYQVKAGDTPSDIAQDLLGNASRWREIIRESTGRQLTDADTTNLQIGEWLILPGGNSGDGNNPPQLQLPRTGGGTHVDQLKQTINTLEKEIDEINSQILDKQNEIKKKEEEIKDKEFWLWSWLPWVKDEINELKDEVTQLQSEISELESKRDTREQERQNASKELEQIAKIPDPWQEIASPYISLLVEAFASLEIRNPLVLAYAAATIGYESSWNPEAQNTTDDAAKTGYPGAGLAQITWKDNYQKVSDLTGIDFVNHPEYMFDPLKSLKAKAAFYKMNNMIPLIEAGYYESAAGLYNSGKKQFRSDYTAKVAAAVPEWIEVFS